MTADTNADTGRATPAGSASARVLDNVVRMYIAIVVLAAGLLLVYLALFAHQEDWPVVVILCLAAAGAERVKLTITDDSPVAISLSGPLVLAAVVVVGPLGTTLVAAAAALGAGIFRRPLPAPRKTIFNIGLFALGGGLASLAYHTLGGGLGTHDVTWRDAIAAVAALAVNSGVTASLLIGVVHLTSGRGIRQIWAEDFRWMPIQVVIAGAIGFTFGVAFLRFGWAGAAVYVAPLVAMREAMRQYTSHSRTTINELRAAHAEADDANQRLRAANESLDITNEGLLKTLAAVIDARDVYLYGHSVQASKYAGQVARTLGMTQHEVRTTELGALLHDIGKIGVSERILNKPAKLTDEEYEEIKSHCAIGYELLSNLPQFDEVADIVLSHHEHFDGSGYPRALKGEQIHRSARIVSVVEAVEAMVSDRPYRKGMTPDEVLRELAEGAGSQWDPEVVEIFSGILSQDRKHLVMRNSALEIALSRTPLVELVRAGLDPSNPGEDNAALRGMSATFMTATEPIFILDAERRIVWVNPTAERVTGFSEAALQARDWTAVCDPAEGRGASSGFGTTRACTLLTSADQRLAVEVSAIPLRTNSAEYWLVLAHEVRARTQVQPSAVTDILTGLSTRAALEDRAREALAAGTGQVALALLDMDGLRAVNETFGRAAGDSGLQILASVIAATVRQADIAARIGGDEFAILMPATSPASAAAVLRRIAERLPAASEVLDFPVQFSGGVAQWDGVGGISELLQRADLALYAERRARIDSTVLPMRLKQNR
ncbi:MAG: HD domain-containing phosphohydrolase [Candidatus Dormibacteria bacterium]